MKRQNLTFSPQALSPTPLGQLPSRKRWQHPLGRILALAAVVRIWHLIEWSHSPFFRGGYLDSGWFDQLAWNLAQGRFNPIEVTFRGPLYTFILSGIYSIFGHSFWPHRIFQLLLGLVTVTLVYRLGLRLFSQREAELAALAAALYGPFLYYEGEWFIETLALALNAGFLLWLFSAKATQPSWLWFGLGGTLALAALGRPNILVWSLLIPLVLEPWKHGNELELRLRKTGVAFAGILMVFLPYGFWTAKHTGDWIFLSSQGGLNLYVGNNPVADGWNTLLPGLRTWTNADILRMTAEEIGHPPSPSETSTWWRQKALEYMASHPGRTLALFFKKTYAFLHGHEIKNNLDLYGARPWSTPLSLLLWDAGIQFPFGLLIPFALLGGILAFWKQHRGGKILVTAGLLYSFSIIIFFVCGKFRLPIIPIFLLLGAYGAVSLRDHWKQSRKEALVAGFLLILMAIPLNEDLAGFGTFDPALAAFETGCALQGQENLRPAVEYYRKALTLQPKFIDAAFNLGNALDNLGRLEEAIEAYRSALIIQPLYTDARINLGVTLAKARRYELAEEALQEVLQQRPGDPIALVNLAMVFSQKGEKDRALATLLEAQNLAPKDPGVVLALGITLDDVGRKEQAAAAYRQVLSLDPENRTAKVHLEKLNQR